MFANHPNLNHKAVARSLTAESVPTREPGTSTESAFYGQVDYFWIARQPGAIAITSYKPTFEGLSDFDECFADLSLVAHGRGKSFA